MARRTITPDEQKERLQLQLGKARDALQAAEKRLSDLDSEREKLVVKIKEKKVDVEKYQALTRESQYSVLDEMLRLKGVNIEDVTKAIANSDMEYLLKLAELKAEEEPDGGPGERDAEDKPRVPVNESKEPVLADTNISNFSAKPVSAVKTNIPVEQIPQTKNPYTVPASYRTDMPSTVALSGQPVREPGGQPVRESGAAGRQPQQPPPPPYGQNRNDVNDITNYSNLNMRRGAVDRVNPAERMEKVLT